MARRRATSTSRFLVLAAVACTAAWPALGGTVANSLSASTTVVSACTVSGTTLNFGSALNPVSGGAVTATSTLTLQCTATTPYSVALNAGANAGGGSNFADRVLKSGANTVPYQLYLDASHTTIWGNGVGSAVYSGNGTGDPQLVTIHGRLPSLTGAAPGVYVDTVTVTVSY